MLGGIVFQLVAIIDYVFLAAEFFFRFYNDKPVRWAGELSEMEMASSNERVKGRKASRRVDGRMKLMLFGMTLMTICLFIRCVFHDFVVKFDCRQNKTLTGVVCIWKVCLSYDRVIERLVGQDHNHSSVLQYVHF